MFHEDRFKYKPLLRGMVDVPSVDDPVLLCSFGGKKYYLGPLNSDGDANFNKDHLERDEPSWSRAYSDKFGKSGKPKSINLEKRETKRLVKEPIIDLDLPIIPRLGVLQKLIPEVIGEVPGDMLFEGRHGNSIRIGSRYKHPYMMLSNGRTLDSTSESMADGGLIGITTYGTLAQHYGYLGNMDDDIQLTSRSVLTSDLSALNNRKMASLYDTLYKTVTEGDSSETLDPVDSIAKYKSSQILITSNRIIMNARLDNLWLSSANDIHIGATSNIAISTGNDLIIESRNTYLGKEAFNYWESGEKEGELKGEPMVFGNHLKEVLQDILALLKTANGLVQGVAVPLTDETGVPQSFAEKIKPIEQKLDRILSQYHFIEPNDVIK